MEKQRWNSFLLEIVILFLSSVVVKTKTTPCNLRATSFGFVCVCTATLCDYLDNPQPLGINNFSIISSSKNGLRFSMKNGVFGDAKPILVVGDHQSTRPRKDDELPNANSTNFEEVTLLVEEGRTLVYFPLNLPSILGRKQFSTNSIKLNIRREIEYQKITGFGGAFTGSVSHVLQQLNNKIQDQIYRSFFAKDGIGYNIIRISIGGCDFDLEPWAYNEIPRNDMNLSNFTKLSTLDEVKLEQIKRMQEIASLEKIKVMAAAWSSPTWMKSNNQWTGLSYLKPEFYQLWANYHLRFLELMEAKNMTVWAISTGNEPLNGVIAWFFVHFMSLGWTPSNQAVWLTDHLGPTIKNSKYHDVLIFGNDDQRYTYPAWFQKMNSSRPDSLKYLDGLAVHWYWDDVFAPTLIDEVHKEMPEKLLINTESCVGDKPWETHGPELGSWDRGEKYMVAFLQDLQHSFNGWIDWNIILDEQGGPNYVKNYVDAPVIVNTTNRVEFYKQPIYYAIGHFSKFIPEGSLRIDTTLSNNINVNAVGFKGPDGRIVVVLFNGDNNAVDIELNDSLRGNVVLNVPARSWHTIIFN